MTTAEILPIVIRFCVQTLFLMTALWIMVKIQKLNYNLLGLLASAAASIALEMALDHYVGPSLGVPVGVAVLVLGVTKSTGADHVDVGFTVAVSFALTFGMNLWLLGMLLGDLRVSAREKEESNNTATHATNHVATATASPTTNTVPVATAEDEAKQRAQETASHFSLKAISQGASHPMAMIHTGLKTYTVFEGESLPVETPGGKAKITCKHVETDRVVLDIDGQEVTLSFSLGAK